MPTLADVNITPSKWHSKPFLVSFIESAVAQRLHVDNAIYHMHKSLSSGCVNKTKYMYSVRWIVIYGVPVDSVIHLLINLNLASCVNVRLQNVPDFGIKLQIRELLWTQ